MRCPAGKSVLRAGVATFNDNIQITVSTPLYDVPGGRWIVDVEPFTGTTFGGGAGGSSVNVRVVCGRVATS